MITFSCTLSNLNLSYFLTTINYFGQSIEVKEALTSRPRAEEQLTLIPPSYYNRQSQGGAYDGQDSPVTHAISQSC